MLVQRSGPFTLCLWGAIVPQAGPLAGLKPPQSARWSRRAWQWSFWTRTAAVAAGLKIQRHGVPSGLLWAVFVVCMVVSWNMEDRHGPWLGGSERILYGPDPVASCAILRSVVFLHRTCDDGRQGYTQIKSLGHKFHEFGCVSGTDTCRSSDQFQGWNVVASSFGWVMSHVSLRLPRILGRVDALGQVGQHNFW